VQAVGRDRADRWQYLYHPAQVVRRERAKQRRLVQFIRALPEMRKRVPRDLAQSGLSRERVLAGVLTILGTCFLRPGSEEYLDQNGSHGIATLQRRHVSVRGATVTFDFVGKARKRQQYELRNRALARLIRELLAYRGEVFKFQNGEGRMVDVRRKHINAYIKEVMGESFSAKDFRTWAANLLCASALARMAPDSEATPRDRKRQITAAIREVAEQLGNTPAVCRTSYVFDSLLDGYQKGRVASAYIRDPQVLTRGHPRSVKQSERALLSLLQRAA
jgi:DNA topoisomerase-1